MTNYIISAKPSAGKSYYASKIAIDLMKNGKTVFTNYPVIYSVPLTLIQKIQNIFSKTKFKNETLSTLKWDDNYVDCGLHDCTIILDEAYKLVNCHSKMTDSQHEFFATTGHNNVDIYVIAQNYARLNLIIREMAIFIIISKFSNPLSLVSKEGRKELTPLFFIAEYYLSEMDYALKKVRKDAVYESKRILFDKKVADSYNTQYYKKKEKPITVIKWIDDMNTKNEYKLKEMVKNEREEKMKNEFILQE